MIKTFTLTILFVFACSIGVGQKQRIDSLKHELSIAKQDTSRVLIMSDLIWAYQFSNPDSALLYAQQGLTLAKQIKFLKGEMNVLSSESFVFIGLGNLPKALELAFAALQIAKSNQLMSEATITLNSMGVIYLTLQDYPKAMSYIRQMKANAEANEEKNISVPYAKTLIGVLFVKMNQLDSALYYLHQAHDDFLKPEYGMGYGIDPLVFGYLGEIQFKRGHYPAALDYYEMSLQNALKKVDHEAISNSYTQIAELYKNLNKTDSSIYYAKKGLTEAEQASQKKPALAAATLLSQLYEPTDAKEALHYYKIAADAKEGLYGAGNIQAIQTMVAKEEERQKEIEASKVAYQNQLKQYAFLTGSGILLLIAFILYRNNKQKQKANKVLETTLTNLKATQSQLIQSEKMASLGELTAGIAHEIQNPLNFVNNFSEVNTELISEMKQEINKGNLEEIRAIANDIEENSEKIVHHGKRADAIVKGMLQHSQSSSGVKELTDINKLADEYLRLSYHGLRAKDKTFNATMQTDFDESVGKINIIPQDIGRVLLNLYNNAFYAVAEKKNASTGSAGQQYEPTVSVSTKKIADKIEVRVNDNGNGIGQNVVDKIFQPFFTTKPTGQGTGLGLSLSYDIIKAHGGEIKVETKEARPDDKVGRGEGAEFIIQLPVQ